MDRNRDYRDRDRDRDRDYPNRGDRDYPNRGDRDYPNRGDRDYPNRGDRSRDRDFHQPRRQSRFSDAPPDHRHSSPPTFRSSGIVINRRSINSPPPPLPSRPPSLGPPPGPRPNFNNPSPPPPQNKNLPPPPLPPQQQHHFPPPPHRYEPPPKLHSLSGQKRGFPFSSSPRDRDPNRDSTPEHNEGSNFVKLFVGSVPRTATEEQIRPLFEEQGRVLEVAFIKDKRTGQQQGCCFIKYATSEEADRAIQFLHNQFTLPEGVGPIQVRYADGERERIGNGTVEYKLFVSSLNKFASEKEVEEIFASYGRIEDVYLMRDERKQSRGCGFVKFCSKDSAMAAISSLNGVYTMRGCDQPLIVRFADPKRPRAGEPRNPPAFGGPCSGSLTPSGIRPAPSPNYTSPAGGQGPQNSWQPMSPKNMCTSPNTSAHGFGNQLRPRPGETTMSISAGGHGSGQGSLAEGSVPGAVSASSTSPKNFNQSFSQAHPNSKQYSPAQKPLSSPQNYSNSLQPHQSPGSYAQVQTPQPSVRPVNQAQVGIQGTYSQAFPSGLLPGVPGQFTPQFQVQHSATSAAAQQPRPSMQPSTITSLVNTQPPAPQQPFSFQQAPSELAQMMSQQTQSLQARYQTSQQAISQLQQQVQLMQPPNQRQPFQHSYQAPKQQTQVADILPTSANTATVAPSDLPSTSSGPAGHVFTAAPTPVKCNWTEHTSPDGFKYYYNSLTNESRWVKPEELTLYEQQQPQSAVQQPQNQPNLPMFPKQPVIQSQTTQSQKLQQQAQLNHAGQLQSQVRHTEQLQSQRAADLHAQFRPTEQFQQPPLSSMYQVSRAVTNQTSQDTAQPAAINTGFDLVRYQQGFQLTQDWARRANS